MAFIYACCQMERSSRENDLYVLTSPCLQEKRRSFSGRVPLRPASRDSRYGQGDLRPAGPRPGVRCGPDRPATHFPHSSANGRAKPFRDRTGLVHITLSGSPAAIAGPTAAASHGRWMLSQPYTANDAFFFRSDAVSSGRACVPIQLLQAPLTKTSSSMSRQSEPATGYRTVAVDGAWLCWSMARSDLTGSSYRCRCGT